MSGERVLLGGIATGAANVEVDESAVSRILARTREDVECRIVRYFGMSGRKTQPTDYYSQEIPLQK